MESNLDINFFVPVIYKSLPKYCVHCVSFTHNTERYIKNQNWRDTQTLLREDVGKSYANRRRDDVKKGNIVQGGKEKVKQNIKN